MVTSSKTSNTLLMVTIGMHVLVTGIHLVFPFVDPGILPKILFHYEQMEHEEIPFAKDYFRETYAN